MAHTYSTDAPERRVMPFFFALLAIGSSYGLDAILRHFHVELPWWSLLPVDTMAFYGLFYWAYDRHVWKWRLVRLLGISKLPLLNGGWSGSVEPTNTSGVSVGLGEAVQVAVDVKQTWTTMLITARTERSHSCSLSASVITTDECSLSYEYMNEPGAGALPTMHAHRGTARLTLRASGQELQGEYYSGRDRQNIGTLNLRRAES